MRRRRLDVYQQSSDWPGKAPAWRSELSQYDRFLLLAASMLDVAVPSTTLSYWHPSCGPSSRIVCPSRPRHLGTAGDPPRRLLLILFRFDDDGKIVEHWDVVQVIPDTAANGDGMF